MGSIVPTSAPTGTGSAFWTATQVGTYTNFGNVVVSANSFATISRTAGGTFSISQTPLDFSNYISNSDLNYNVGINKFNKIDNTLGGHTFQNQGINNLGVIGTNSGWVGAKIPVSENTQYSFLHNDGFYLPNQVGLLAYLNSSGGIISTVDMTTLTTAGGLGGKTLTTPSGTTFIYKNVKVSAGGTKDYIDTFQLELGSLTTTYKSYEAQIDKMKSSKLIDTDGRELISANTVAINANTTTLVKDTNVISIVAKPNTVNTTLIQLDLVFPLSAITYSSGTEFQVGGTVISNSLTMTGIGSRGFQNTVSTATSILGTATPTAGSNSPFTAPSTNFIRKTYFNQTGATYLHYYIEFTTTTGTTENIILKNTYLKVGGTTIYPLTYGLYKPNGADVVKELYYSDNSLIYGSILDKKLLAYPTIASIQPNPLNGKVLATIGDSMVKGHSLPANQVWDSLIANRNGMTNFNYGINGTQLTNDNGFGQSVLNRFSGMTSSADYIGVFAGTNDDVANVAIGADTDSYSAGQLTFKGALNDLCSGLITKYPDKKIFFITPYFRRVQTQNYITAIITIAKKYSIPVFDNWTNGGVCWSNSTQVSAITLGDTYHLNQAGMYFVATKYEAFLRSL